MLSTLRFGSTRGQLLNRMNREHQELDDQALEKLHTDAIQGKFRSKRRDRGVGFDSDDDEDEDEDTRDLRRRMNRKKRKIEDDSLDQLGKTV